MCAKNATTEPALVLEPIVAKPEGWGECGGEGRREARPLRGGIWPAQPARGGVEELLRLERPAAVVPLPVGGRHARVVTGAPCRLQLLGVVRPPSLRRRVR